MEIIVVSEKTKKRERMLRILEGKKVVMCKGFLEGIEEIIKRKGGELVVVAEYKMTPYNGVELLKSVKKMKGRVYTVLMIEEGDREGEMEGLRNEIDLMIEEGKADGVIRAYIEKLMMQRRKVGEVIKRNKLVLNGIEVELTRKELEVVRILIENKGEIMGREEIVEKIWNSRENVRKVDIHIKEIRKKLERSGLSNYIVTVSGVGYRWIDLA